MAWRRNAASIEITATVPANTTADVHLPDGRTFEVGSGDHKWAVTAPDPEPHQELTTSSSLAMIMDDPDAYRTVLDAFARIDPEVSTDFRRRMAWVPNQPLFGTFSLISPAVVDEVERSLAELNRSRGLPE